MPQLLSPKYSLFDSIAEMLSPQALSNLTGKLVTEVTETQITEHSGVAGSTLHYIQTNSERYVLKRMKKDNDYLMTTTDDHLCRSVTLWQYGLLDELLPLLEHKIIACAKDIDDEWAILMVDLTSKVHDWENNMLSPDDALLFLDRMAHLHATFWNDPRLDDPQLGLGAPSVILEAFSPKRAAPLVDTFGMVPSWFVDGWETLPKRLAPDIYEAIVPLAKNPTPLFEAMARYPHTLLHMDYRLENFAQGDVPIALDWQLASKGLMTAGLGWYIRLHFFL